MRELARDLRFGIRMLARSPVFAITAASLLAVGISANTLMFSVVNALLLRPLPVAHPENLVRLVEVHPNNFVTWSLPYGFCEAVAAATTDLAEMLCQGETDVPFSDGRTTERVRVHLVSPNFFSSLGVGAALGRVLTADDDRTAATNAVLGYSFWQRWFERDPSVLGRGITLGGHAFTIVGVSREGFNGLDVETSPDIRVPAAVERSLIPAPPDMNPAVRHHMFGQIFGRLRTGIPFERASREMDSLMRTYRDEIDRLFTRAVAPSANRITSHLRLESVANGVSTLREQFSRGLQVSMAGVALLLLMACANVAGLLLARSAVRAPEIGIRLAVGASPGRIVRQLFTEGFVLALAGGIAGIVLARACLPLAVRALPPVRDRMAVLHPLAIHIGLDWRVLGFAAAITFTTSILFALSPALRSARTDVASSLRGGRTVTRRLLARDLIVTGQVALCTLILMGAALLVETLHRMQTMDAGFDQDHIVTFTIDPSLRNYTRQQTQALSMSLLEKAGALPGVRAAAIAGRPLMRGTGVKATFGAAGAHIQPSDFLNSSLNDVTPGYFAAMGMHILAGRDFTWFDRNQATPRLVVVNRAFARHFFPGRSPLGERIGFPGPGGIATADYQIVGIVSDAKYRSLREPVPPTVYNPVVDGFTSDFVLHVRTRERPEALIAPVRALLGSLDPQLPIIETHTLHEEVEASLWQERLLAWLSTAFGLMAAFLAGIGLYGALDFAVKSRTREIGVRMALGARPGQIAGLLSRTTLLMVASGIAAGLGVYGAVAAVLRRILYDVPSWDPAALATVLVLLGLVALAGALPAAWRAVRVDAASALRSA